MARDVLGLLVLASVAVPASGGSVNDTLRRALADARLDEIAVSAALSVDPKTVQRWIAGRIPQRRHRWGLADLIGQHERDLWPDLSHGGTATRCSEIRASYPYRGAVPDETWYQLFAGAEREIGVLAYSGLFLAENVRLLRAIAGRARAGVRVRVLLGDPDSPAVAGRGVEEGITEAMPAKVRNALVHYRPLAGDGVEIRLHGTVLYNSLYRADDELLVNTHVHGVPAAHAPVLHLSASSEGDLVTTYLDSFERIWDRAAG
jgi:hypothetical protein